MISVGIVVSTVGGVLAALAGVLAGGIITNRSQLLQWLRGSRRGRVRTCCGNPPDCFWNWSEQPEES